MSKVPHGKVKTTFEFERMVNAFFEKALIRDMDGIVVGSRITRQEFDWVANGMKPPTVPPDLCELILNARQRSNHVSIFTKIKLEWRDRLGAIAQTIERKSYEERVARLAPIDHLKLLVCNPEKHPTEATLVAKMYLVVRSKNYFTNRL